MLISGNSIGDDCESDADGDKVAEDDTCPKDGRIFTTDFQKSDEIMLSKLDKNSQKFPKWIVRDKVYTLMAPFYWLWSTIRLINHIDISVSISFSNFRDIFVGKRGIASQKQCSFATSW